MRFLLSILTVSFLMICAIPARACINDREVGKAEREFKSSYMSDTPTGQPANYDPSPDGDAMTPMAILGTGAMLLVGATLVSLKRPGLRAS